MIEFLDSLHAAGDSRAQAHFDELLASIHNVVPPELTASIPKTREAMGGIFTASTRAIYVALLTNIPGYYPVSMSMTYDSLPGEEGAAVLKGWHFVEFCINVSGAQGGHGHILEFTANNLEDAVVMSKRLYTLNEKAVEGYYRAQQQIQEIPAKLM